MKLPLPISLQNLPPKQAHLCLSVEHFIREILGDDIQNLSGSRVLLGCSGGLDSTALLLILQYLAPRMGFTLIVAHLDHQLRPESTEDSAHVQNLCNALSLPCVVHKENVTAHAQKNAKGIEEAARDVRYAFFKRTAEQQNTQWLITAHQADDLAEDILMRLIRGTGWPALGGMSAYDTKRTLFRPLLNTPRKKLHDFLKETGIPWCEDASNTDETYLRNRVRHNIIPLFLQENPAFLEATTGIWKLARIDEAYWKIIIDESLAKGTNFLKGKQIDHKDVLAQPIILEKFVLSNLPLAGRLRLFKAALEKLGAGQPLQENLFKLDKAWQRGEGGKTIQFPGKKIARIERGNVIFTQ